MKFRGILWLAGLACALQVHAQSVMGGGAVVGTVVDYTGSGIPDTTVILSNERLGVQRTFGTTDDGCFFASLLAPGTGYKIKVTRKGFVDLDYNDFEVLAGHTLDFRIVLVEVPGSTHNESEKASISWRDKTYGLQTTLTESETDALPTRNRDANTLAPSLPVVTRDWTTGNLNFQSEPGTNAFVLDGILTNKTYFYTQTPLVTPPQDVVEELQIASMGAPAEFGHVFGGTINMVTRGSTDALHGAAYDYYNNHSLNTYDKLAPWFRPSDYQQQFGGYVSGPVWTKKLLYFVSAEDLDRHTQELNLALNPLISNPTGTAIQASDCTATAAQCATTISFLNAQLDRAINSSLLNLNGIGRIDYRPNPNSAISFEVEAARLYAPDGTHTQTVSGNGSLLGYNGTYADISRFARASYTVMWNQNETNEVRAGFYHDRYSDYEDKSLLPSTGAVGIDIAGTQFGGNTQLPIALSEQRYEFGDTLSAALGAHILKAGFDYMLNQDWNRQIIDYAGSYYYPTLTAFADDFAAGKKDYITYDQAFGRPVVSLHSRVMNIYAQDAWNLARHWNIVAGILWEKQYIPQPVDVNTTFYQTASISSPNIDFSPRIGIAYQINDRTVLRLGVGSYYEGDPGQLLEALYLGNGIYQLPFTADLSQTAAPVFPRTIGAPTGIPSGTANLAYATGKFRSPVSAQGALSLERQLSRDTTASLSILYDRGIALLGVQEENQNAPTVQKTYTIDNAAGAAVGSYTTYLYNSLVNTGYGHAYQVGNVGNSAFMGATLKLRRQMTHGLSFEGAYTWSHAIDNVSGSPALAGYVPAPYTPNDFPGDKGDSSFNQPNRVVVKFVWTSGSGGGDWFERYLVHGWTLSGLALLASGLGETPLALDTNQQFGGVTMSYLTSLNGSGEWARAPFEPVNSLNTGNQYDLDLRLTRDIPITERIKAKLMFEGYDVLNRQWNTSVNTIAYLATSGVLKPVAGVGSANSADGFPWGDNARHIQVAFKVTF